MFDDKRSKGAMKQTAALNHFKSSECGIPLSGASVTFLPHAGVFHTLHVRQAPSFGTLSTCGGNVDPTACEKSRQRRAAASPAAKKQKNNMKRTKKIQDTKLRQAPGRGALFQCPKCEARAYGLRCVTDKSSSTRFGWRFRVSARCFISAAAP